MEFEQIIKRLDFLEKQQRATRDTIADLTERVNACETSVNAVSKQIKTLAKQVGDIAPVAKRVDQFETMISKQRTELIKMIEENEKNQTRTQRDASKALQTELSDLSKTVLQLKGTVNSNITETKKTLKERGDEIQRILGNLGDLKNQIDNAKRATEDSIGSVKAMDETRKNDLKRIADLQGEIAAVRKRVDENRDKYTLVTDGIRNIENRFNELLASEQERRQAQLVFIEQQSVAHVDRERAWKEWNTKFESFQKEASAIDTHIQELDDVLRGAKKAQEAYLELNTKLERRISEVTEMQRLAEERLRQEWVTFKTDDQKRWTGYSLSAEESFRDIRKDLQKVGDGIPPLTDSVQVLQDQMHQVTDASEKQLQEMMNVVHEWMTSYQRIMGHGKKITKK